VLHIKGIAGLVSSLNASHSVTAIHSSTGAANIVTPGAIIMGVNSANDRFFSKEN
jgi:hypothetical protein